MSTSPSPASQVDTAVLAPHVSDADNVLLGPDGRWAVRLTHFTPMQAHLLLVMLNDLTPLSSQTEATLTLRLTAYDEAATRDVHLATEIRVGLEALETLARRMTNCGYADIAERRLRRPLLMQLAHLPLMQRLGVAHTTYAFDAA